MDDKHTINEVCIMLGAIKEQNISGFKGIHDRQDKTNGNVKDNTEFRLQTNGALMMLKILMGFFGIGTIINLVITLYGNFS